MEEYGPKLIPDRRIPFEVRRICEDCKEPSLAVNFTGEVYVRCCNPVCFAKDAKHYIPCMLKHRDYAHPMLNTTLQEGIPIEEVEFDKKTGLIDMHSPVFNPQIDSAPYQLCDGYLIWDEDLSITRDTWLLCNKCKAAYHMLALTTYGLEGAKAWHNMYTLEVSKKETNIIKDWDRKKRVGYNYGSISKEVAMVFFEIRFNGEQVRDAAPLFRM
jgi:hypothetical protein